MEQHDGMATAYPRRGQSDPHSDETFWRKRNGSQVRRPNAEVQQVISEAPQKRERSDDHS